MCFFMFFDFSYSPFEGFCLLLSMIIFGKLFKENWINKNGKWVVKSWIYGLISSLSFFVMVLLPMNN